MKTIVLTGGGTAGHVTPNLALLPYLKADGYQVYYIGSKDGMEKEIVNRYGIAYYGISSGKLRRYFDKKNFSDIFKVIQGIFQAKKLIKRLKPDIVFSKGGFVAVPVVIGAKMNKVPVICHESDITPGLANKLAMPFAKAVCVTFPEALSAVKGDKGKLTGTPIRDNLFKGERAKGLELSGLSGNKPVMLVMGGSQGSVKVNTAIRKLLPQLTQSYDIIHLCGKGNLDTTLSDYSGYVQFEYLSKELPDIFAASDFVVTRAGSNAICEFLALNKPMLLIPLSKRASRGDQILNANSFCKLGFADVCDEDTMTEEILLKQINSLYENRDKYIAKMKAADVAKGTAEVMSLIREYTKEKEK
jgi:UDP-N-acetylglucosamine--N-acetylmuramyl-(pentapeptide) pyrophosphoryl-undecaprenol N-acetylglucosamine transferase